ALHHAVGHGAVERHRAHLVIRQGGGVGGRGRGHGGRRRRGRDRRRRRRSGRRRGLGCSGRFACRRPAAADQHHRQRRRENFTSMYSIHYGQTFQGDSSHII